MGEKELKIMPPVIKEPGATIEEEQSVCVAHHKHKARMPDVEELIVIQRPGSV